MFDNKKKKKKRKSLGKAEETWAKSRSPFGGSTALKQASSIV